MQQRYIQQSKDANICKDSDAMSAMRLSPKEAHLVQPGSMNNVAIRTLQPTVVPLGHIETILDVQTAGLNFRDVLNVLGLDPTGTVRPIGGEASGVVSDVGLPGGVIMLSSEVYGLVPGCLRTCAISDSRYTSRMPRALNFAQAITLPVVWTTAHYCLTEAQLHSVQAVLVHWC